jgi:hypothetical protein
MIQMNGHQSSVIGHRSSAIGYRSSAIGHRSSVSRPKKSGQILNLKSDTNDKGIKINASVQH